MKPSTNRKIFNLKHARDREQLQKMKELAQLGICPFCPKNLKEFHDHPIEKIGKFWSVTKNDYPYTGTSHHYLFIYRRHLCDLTKIKPEASAELIKLLSWLKRKLRVPGGALVFRSGKSDYTGSSIEHLHGHFIAGNKETKDSEFLSITVGYKKKSR